MNNNFADKISLGTAQLGMDYGIANERGMVKKHEAFQILEYAGKNGIKSLDTACSYGGSEDVIGEFFARFGGTFDITSKVTHELAGGTAVEKCLLETLSRLRQPGIYGYLAHKFSDVRDGMDFWNALRGLKEKRLVQKIGVSLYNTEELDYLLDHDISFDIVQVPYSIFDQRFENYFPIIRKKSVEIHVRSVFLQGLFFLKDEVIGKRFNGAKPMIDELRAISEGCGVPVGGLCLCFAVNNPNVDKVIIGVDSLEQLEQNIGLLKYADEVNAVSSLLRSLKLDNEDIILPYKWKI